ncbi:DUF4237 domain-containing protein [Listeria monocytogenes]|uniref:glycohydrolase toxin TNT-related protein n=1 Tax=Listeria monocytogenes TaxID=1639 RepID=UPI0011EB8DCC|nr:glycohydrolase toxin TNT-related protein [Listeria monocytogenes]EAV9826843.1 DUF4237 domain-containing protein [Listeria monocytogenes]TYW27380.1 DUF4237 domain-containing protein [Listeria monocytogenes]
MKKMRGFMRNIEKWSFNFKDLASVQQGEIAQVFGAGGGTQIQLGTVVDWYEKLNLLKEIK